MKKISVILLTAIALTLPALVSCQKDDLPAPAFVNAAPNANRVLTPVFTVEESSCWSGTQVFIGAEISMNSYPDDAEIYYTDDGTTPSKTNGTKYDGTLYKIPAAAQTTLKAIAYRDGWETSEVMSTTFTVPQLGTPKLSVYNWYPDKILLNWNDVDNADYYTVTYVKQNSGEKPASKNVSRLVRYTYLDQEYGNLPSGTTYDITIQARSDRWMPSEIYSTTGYTTGRP